MDPELSDLEQFKEVKGTYIDILLYVWDQKCFVIRLITFRVDF